MVTPRRTGADLAVHQVGKGSVPVDGMAPYDLLPVSCIAVQQQSFHPNDVGLHSRFRVRSVRSRRILHSPAQEAVARLR